MRDAGITLPHADCQESVAGLHRAALDTSTTIESHEAHVAKCQKCITHKKPLAKHTGRVTQSGPREGLPGGANVPFIASAYDNNSRYFHRRADHSMWQQC